MEAQKFHESACHYFTKEVVEEARKGGFREVKILIVLEYNNMSSVVLFMRRLWFVNDSYFFELDRLRNTKL